MEWPKRSILFVDDEPEILDAIRRGMRPMRDEWDMDFATSGQEALERFETAHYDVVVSDMRMPGMDGAVLLGEIMATHPQTVRIVLSGLSEQEMILQTVGVAHRYLAKPCNPELIRQIVRRTCNLRDHLTYEPLRALVSEMTSLPGLPALYQELVEEARSPMASTRRMGEIISKDIGMTVRVLQIVNSAYFGLPRYVSSAVEAITLLGQETVITLVLCSRIAAECGVKFVGTMPVDVFWSESLQTGALARAIAKSETRDRMIMQEAFTAGILSDVGRLILASEFPHRYVSLKSAGPRCDASLVDAERIEFGASHPEIGAYLLGLWGLPDPIVEAVAFHHRPGDANDGSFSALTAVHAAHALRGARSGGEETIDDGYLSSLGVSDRMEHWQAICDEIGAPAAD